MAPRWRNKARICNKLLNGIRSLMFRREFWIISCIGIITFGTVLLATAWVAQRMRTDAKMMVIDTVPGLIVTGRAIAIIERNWTRVNMLPHLASNEERLKMIQEISTNSTEHIWNAYAESIYEKED